MNADDSTDGRGRKSDNGLNEPGGVAGEEQIREICFESGKSVMKLLSVFSPRPSVDLSAFVRADAVRIAAP